MKRIEIKTLKNNYVKILNALKTEKKILLCDQDVPIAELTAIERKSRSKRVFGKHLGWLTFDPTEFEKGDQVNDFDGNL